MSRRMTTRDNPHYEHRPQRVDTDWWERAGLVIVVLAAVLISTTILIQFGGWITALVIP